MKKIILAALAVATIAAPAVAKDKQTPSVTELFVPFQSKGECQSTYMQVHNYYRNNVDVRWDADKSLSPSEYNAADKAAWACVEHADGYWYFEHL